MRHVRRTRFWAAALAVMVAASGAGVASAQQLSDKTVTWLMGVAWSMTPAQFTKPNGEAIMIDRKNKDAVMVPIDVGREVVVVGHRSAHAQRCELPDDQTANYRSLMLRYEKDNKYTPQQLVYISQLHLTTVMVLLGQVQAKSSEDGGKTYQIQQGAVQVKTCTDEERKKVKELITEYVKSGPPLKS